MPRKKKKDKTKEQITAENFFPVDADDLKRATVKEVKTKIESSTSTVEKIVKQKENQESKLNPPKTKGKTTTKITKTKKSYKEKSKPKEPFITQKINLKEGGYELIITEKPQAAFKIATALGKAEKKQNGNVPWYEIERKGKKIIVGCAVGHLLTLTQSKKVSGYPIFDIHWQPNYLSKKNDFSKKYFEVLLKLAKGAGKLTVATDYDIEGEVIGLNVVRFIAGQKDASRMKFSTLTEKELNDAYESKSDSLNWGQAIAGETRHYLDWFYGINLSRALMSALRSINKFKIMSIGRVQGPALKLIVEKEREILAFKPQTYWQVFINLENPKDLELKYNKDIFKKQELSSFENLKGKTGIANTKTSEQVLPPNPPFNLTSLQTEAYKFYGITPSETLRIAQGLYLNSLISYPRTSSQKLPISIGYKPILEKLAKIYKAEKLITRKTPIEGKKSDPAHPSIYPTGNTQALEGNDKKIYDLIVKRFISLFCEDAILSNKKIEVDVEGKIFSAKGSEIVKKSWLSIYPFKLAEKQVPDVKGEVKIANSRTEEKETQPPRRYSPASILSELEKRNLGTKATRASILETLYDRGYIKDKSVKATPLGISLIETMEKYSPIIIDEKLTREFEKDMDSIVTSKHDLEKKEQKIIDKAKKAIINISKDFEKNDKKIGQALTEANLKLREEQNKENTLNECPVCKKGQLRITYSKKTKRFFIACNAYPNCKNTYSLPPNSAIKRVEGKVCESCSFPMLMSLKSGKAPWIFCFNPNCEKNRERLEEYRKKKEQEENNS